MLRALFVLCTESLGTLYCNYSLLFIISIYFISSFYVYDCNILVFSLFRIFLLHISFVYMFNLWNNVFIL